MASEVIGFIGLGIMGRPMALNLIKAGYKLVVTSRSRGPIDVLAEAGARAVATPADVAREADVVITMVPDTPDVELVLRGKNGVDGVLGGLKKGAIVIRSEEHTSELQSQSNLVCRLLLEKKKNRRRARCSEMERTGLLVYTGNPLRR